MSYQAMLNFWYLIITTRNNEILSINVIEYHICLPSEVTEFHLFLWEPVHLWYVVPDVNTELHTYIWPQSWRRPRRCGCQYLHVREANSNTCLNVYSRLHFQSCIFQIDQWLYIDSNRPHLVPSATGPEMHMTKNITDRCWTSCENI